MNEVLIQLILFYNYSSDTMPCGKKRSHEGPTIYLTEEEIEEEIDGADSDLDFCPDSDSDSNWSGSSDEPNERDDDARDPGEGDEEEVMDKDETEDSIEEVLDEFMLPVLDKLPDLHDPEEQEQHEIAMLPEELPDIPAAPPSLPPPPPVRGGACVCGRGHGRPAGRGRGAAGRGCGQPAGRGHGAAGRGRGVAAAVPVGPNSWDS